MEIINPESDEFGRLRVQGIHDAVVVGLVLGPQRGEFAFVTAQGTKTQLILESIGPFGFSGFRNGAIVESVYAHRLGPAGSAPMSAWVTLFAGDFAATDPDAAAVISSMSERHRLLVVVECSYGGAFACACEAVRVVTE